MDYFAKLGASKSKLVMGMPMYGQAFTINDQSNTGLGSAGSKGAAGKYTRAAGFLAFYEICEFMNSGWTVVKDPEGRMGPYAYKGNQWVGFDDVEMIERKSKWVMENGYGGGMIWALDLDDFKGQFCGCGRHPLLKTINRVMRNYQDANPSTCSISRAVQSQVQSPSPAIVSFKLPYPAFGGLFSQPYYPYTYPQPIQRFFHQYRQPSVSIRHG